jgi:hypothetical protein
MAVYKSWSQRDIAQIQQRRGVFTPCEGRVGLNGLNVRVPNNHHAIRKLTYRSIQSGQTSGRGFSGKGKDGSGPEGKTHQAPRNAREIPRRHITLKSTFWSNFKVNLLQESGDRFSEPVLRSDRNFFIVTKLSP